MNTDMQLVPKEPTAEMIAAFKSARPATAVWDGEGWTAPAPDWFRAQYAAMLGAAQQEGAAQTDAELPSEQYIARAMTLADEYAHLQAVADGESFITGADVTEAEQEADDARTALMDHLIENARNAVAAPAPQAAQTPIPPEIAAIIENLHTQDNRITQDPLFAVQQKRVIGGLHRDYAEKACWVDGDGEVTDPEEIAKLDALDGACEILPDGVRRLGYIEVWEFVTGGLTEQGCKDYIACNGHNLNEPRIYAYGGYRNAEVIALRKWLMNLRGAAAVAPAQLRMLTENEGLTVAQSQADFRGQLSLTYDHGPYEVTSLNLVAREFIDAIQRKFCEVNGIPRPAGGGGTK